MTEHPKTGHPCATPKGDDGYGQLPEDITIEIKRSRCFIEADHDGTCGKGTKGCFCDHEAEKDIWYAELSGYVNLGDGRLAVWAQLTHGSSVAHAAAMAADVAKLCYEACKDVGVPHCYCRDATHSFPGDEDVRQVKVCCLCDVLMGAEAFEPPVDPDWHTPDPTSADVRALIADATDEAS